MLEYLYGTVAEWLRSGLQNRVHRFNSGRCLHFVIGFISESEERVSKTTRRQPRSAKPAKSAGATLPAKSSQPAKNVATAASAKAPKHAEPTQPANSLITLTARVERLERKINSNERFARTFVRSVLSQTAATEAIQDVIRHSFREDAALRKELYAAMDTYDKRRFRKIASGFTTILLWVVSVIVAAFVGAFIHWVFYGIKTQ